MKDVIHRWAAAHMLSMSAKYKQSNNKDVDDITKSQFTQQRDALTDHWSEEYCHGQAAVLVLKLVAAFHEHTLLLAYGQQANHHLRLQIQDEVSGVIEHVRQNNETPSLDKLFKAFKPSAKAAAALKESKHDKVLERTKADNQEFLKGLTSMLATSAAPTARTRAGTAFDPRDPCKFWTGRPNSCAHGANCRWKDTHIPNKTGVEASAQLMAQA
ncbi:TPA: hypothetical protein ACH3X1_015100 [Trebouxia sp. C0004]